MKELSAQLKKSPCSLSLWTSVDYLSYFCIYFNQFLMLFFEAIAPQYLHVNSRLNNGVLSQAYLKTDLLEISVEQDYL
jgi:hypothetical protein